MYSVIAFSGTKQLNALKNGIPLLNSARFSQRCTRVEVFLRRATCANPDSGGLSNVKLLENLTISPFSLESCLTSCLPIKRLRALSYASSSRREHSATSSPSEDRKSPNRVCRGDFEPLQDQRSGGLCCGFKILCNGDDAGY